MWNQSYGICVHLGLYNKHHDWTIKLLCILQFTTRNMSQHMLSYLSLLFHLPGLTNHLFIVKVYLIFFFDTLAFLILKRIAPDFIIHVI